MEIKEFTAKANGLFQMFFVDAVRDGKIKFLDELRSSPWDFRKFIGAFSSEKLVGVICYNYESYKDPTGFGIGFVSVHEDHKNNGIATMMLDKFFDLAKNNNKKVYNSWYEPEGQRFLKDTGMIDRIARKHKVIMIEG